MSSSSEISEVGGVIGHCGAEIPDNDICSCCTAMSWAVALYVSGTLFGGCGTGDEGGELISLSSLERYIGSVAMGSSSSSIRNMVVISVKALFLKCLSAVIDETKF